MLYSRLKDYMFRPVVAIRSLSFNTLKNTLYSRVVAYLMRRSQHQGLFWVWYIIYIRCVGETL